MSLFGFGKSHKPMEDVEQLATVYDFGMRSVIESILRDAEIPYIIKDCGGSMPIITGSPMLGADFYVKNTDLETARRLIAPCFENNDGDDPQTSDEADKNDADGDEK